VKLCGGFSLTVIIITLFSIPVTVAIPTSLGETPVIAVVNLELMAVKEEVAAEVYFEVTVVFCCRLVDELVALVFLASWQNYWLRWLSVAGDIF
jgi:hypothetical protein